MGYSNVPISERTGGTVESPEWTVTCPDGKRGISRYTWPPEGDGKVLGRGTGIHGTRVVFEPRRAVVQDPSLALGQKCWALVSGHRDVEKPRPSTTVVSI